MNKRISRILQCTVLLGFIMHNGVTTPGPGEAEGKGAAEISHEVVEALFPSVEKKENELAAQRAHEHDYRPEQGDIATLSAWSNRCFKELVESKSGITNQEKFPPTPLSIEEFTKALAAFIKRFGHDFLNNDLWFGHQAPDKIMFDCTKPLELVRHKKWIPADKKKNARRRNIHLKEEFFSAYHPFVQRMVVPDSSRICLIGDLHGSVHSLLRNMWRLVSFGWLDDNFKLVNENLFIIFNGDFVDRGRYGVECIYTLLRLKMANWNNVFFVRGNHENLDASHEYTFYREFDEKYPNKLETWDNYVVRFFELLPFALYVGAGKHAEHAALPNFVQCCHGGVETGYNPQAFLASTKTFDRIPDAVTASPCVGELRMNADDIEENTKKNNYDGFNWSDFCQNMKYQSKIKDLGELDQGSIAFPARSVVGYLTDIAGARTFLEQHSIKAFFRGHQDMSYGFKMFFSVDKSDEVYQKIGAGEIDPKEYDDGPYHWQYVVNDAEERKTLSVSNHEPVFTFSTATEGQRLSYDCFGILAVAHDYHDWKLMPHEYFLEPHHDLRHPENRKDQSYVRLHHDGDVVVDFIEEQSTDAEGKRQKNRDIDCAGIDESLRTIAIQNGSIRQSIDQIRQRELDVTEQGRERRNERLQPAEQKAGQQENAALEELLEAHKKFMEESEDDRGRHPFFDRLDEESDDLFSDAIKEIARYGDINLDSLIDRDEDNRTLLHFAAYLGLPKAVKALLDENASINATTSNQETPLHIAARKGHLSVVEELCRAGADQFAKNIDDETALDIAGTFKHEEIVSFLKNKEQQK